MAAQVQKITFGIDVSKDTLDIYEWHSGQVWSVANQPKAITKFLKSQVGLVQMAVEPTSSYHLEMIDRAHALGHEVFLVNARSLAHYRDAVGERNKTDLTDAWLLARYLDRERDQLRAFTPPRGDARRLWSLIKRRAVVVNVRKQLRSSMTGVVTIKATERELNRLLARIDAHIVKLIDKLGWSAQYRCCLTIPGIGPVNAAAVVAAYHRGAFASANAFIAYLGLDIRVRQSGRHRGKSKLSKHGEPELRRLLWCAAKPSRSYAPFARYHQAQLDKGLSKIAANVTLARKLARIAFALLRDASSFKRRTESPCMKT